MKLDALDKQKKYIKDYQVFKQKTKPNKKQNRTKSKKQNKSTLRNILVELTRSLITLMQFSSYNE